MPVINIEREMPGKGKEIKTLDVPDEGVHQTAAGEIVIAILKRRPATGTISSMLLSGEMLIGTSLKGRHKRSRLKIVSIGIGGYGEQTLSKREKVKVRTRESLPDHPGHQIELSLSVPQVVK